MNVPEKLHYTDQHEWAEQNGEGVRVGITDYAQDALGDVVFVKLPEVGQKAKAGEVICEVESTKSVSEIYAPISGQIKEVNQDLSNSPDAINSSPYEKGWICVIAPENPSELDSLLDASGYTKLIENA